MKTGALVALTGFLKRENTVLKNRLAECCWITSSKGILAQARHYQNLFIIKDEFIDELRHDVNVRVQSLTAKFNGKLDEKMLKNGKNSRNEMEYGKDFASLKNGFNRYHSNQFLNQFSAPRISGWLVMMIFPSDISIGFSLLKSLNVRISDSGMCKRY